VSKFSIYTASEVARRNGSMSGKETDASDEQWIVSQANFYRNSDLNAAKSWLLVGRSLFPRNFHIQVGSELVAVLASPAVQSAFSSARRNHFPADT